MEWVDQWAYAGNVKINYLESRDHDERLMPILYIPGALNDAEQLIELLDAFYPRKRVAVSLRGYGKSEASQSGYSLDDHASEYRGGCHSKRIGGIYPLGMPYAIRFAAKHAGVKGLIIGDYPVIPESWAEWILERLDMAGKERAVRGIQKESWHIDLYEELAAINIPVLVIRGTLEDVMLKDADVERYKQSLQQLDVMEIEGAGHEYWENGRESFLESTKEFLRKLDNTDQVIK